MPLGVSRKWRQTGRMKLSGDKAAFLDAGRIAYLATADRRGEPHVVPVCFIRLGEQIYITIDQKPKRLTELKRLRNIVY